MHLEQANKKRADPIPGLCEDARRLGVSRVTLLRAIHGRFAPRDKTLLPRYYALQKERQLGTQPHFAIFPPETIWFGDDAFMRRTAAAYPDAFLYENGGLRVLRPTSFWITDLPQIPAQADSRPTP